MTSDEKIETLERQVLELNEMIATLTVYLASALGKEGASRLLGCIEEIQTRWQREPDINQQLERAADIVRRFKEMA